MTPRDTDLTGIAVSTSAAAGTDAVATANPAARE
jgi:hypothetical protein